MKKLSPSGLVPSPGMFRHRARSVAGPGGRGEVAASPKSPPAIATAIAGAGVVALCLAGCQTAPGPSTQSSGSDSKSVKPVSTSIHALDGSFGRIDSVRPELALAVLDYSLSTMPEVGATLSVERGGREVGKIRVTGPTRAGTGKIAGEVISGAPMAGDTVREP